MEEVKFRATKLLNFSLHSQEEDTPIAQCIINTASNTYLYILYNNSISILNIENGNRDEIQCQNNFLPIITYDPTDEDPVPYLCTENGQLCQIREGEIISEPQIIGPNPFILYNNQIIIGDHKSGIISLFDKNNQNNPKFKINRYESFSLKIIKIFSSHGILSLAANSKFIFALSQDRTVLVFDINNGRKISSTTISGENILHGTIKCDEDNYYFLVFSTKNDTKLLAFHFSDDENDLLYEIKNPVINFIDVKNDNLLVMSKNELTLHNKLDGKIIYSFLLPIDDISIFKSKYLNDKNPIKNKEISQSPSNIRKVKRDFTPKFAYLTNNNILYITTNSAIYRCRPVLPIESYILNLRINKELELRKQNQTPTNIFNSAVEFARTISRENWIEFEKNARTTSDPTLFAYKIILQYLNREYKDFEGILENDINDQIDEIINSLSLNAKNHNQHELINNFQNDESKNPFSEFYRSACSEVIFAYSFFCRCIYFLVMFLTYKNQTAKYSHQLRKLSFLVHKYTQLSLIAEIGEYLPIELFELHDYNDNDENDFNIVFSKTVMSMILSLSNFDNTMKVLMEHEMYESVVKITSINSVPLVCYGVSLLKLKKYDDAVDFFIQNSGFLTNDKDLAESIFEILRTDNRDDLIIRIGSNNSVANAAALFRAYIKEKDYDSAFNCILTTQNEAVKCDMLRVFISLMKKNKLHQRLLSYPFNTMISTFVNELWCYSKDTLILAVSFFREIGDPYQAVQALYLSARCLLRTPTRENLGKAITLMSLVYSHMNNNINISVRDIGPKNQELTIDKLWRIINRTRCCLLLDDNEYSTISKNRRLENSTSINDASEFSFLRLLEIAAQRNDSVFEKAITGAHNKEIIELIPKLVHQKLIKPLKKVLSMKNNSKDTHFVQKTLATYIDINQVPPSFVIDKFITKNATKLLLCCSVTHSKIKQNLVFDVILSLLHRQDVKKFFYLEPILRKFNLPDEIIEKFQK